MAARRPATTTPAVPDDRTPLRRRLALRLVNVLTLLGLGAATLTIAGFAGGLWWPLDLASHFRAQYLVVLLALGPVLWCARRRALAVTMVTLGTVNLATILPLYRAPDAPVGPAGPARRFMLVNVRTGNPRHDLVAEEIRRRDPDVLVLQEVNDRWLAALADVVDAFPHAITRTRSDNFGIAVFSRHEMTGRVAFLGSSRVPSIVTRLTLDGVPLTFIATHPVPPTGAAGSRRRNTHLAALAELVSGLDGPVVVLGDLNATPWSAAFRALLAGTDLRDASRGHGLHATWPTSLPPLLIPIDHCLHSAGVEIVAERVGSFVGSDHYPLIVDGRVHRPTVAAAP